MVDCAEYLDKNGKPVYVSPEDRALLEREFVTESARRDCVRLGYLDLPYEDYPNGVVYPTLREALANISLGDDEEGDSVKLVRVLRRNGTLHEMPPEMRDAIARKVIYVVPKKK